mmetsp:Transcript_16860/g.48074  ORF Transcript_16860/g.48074 Transcript_16860/m.48074 type:complete len:276 (-) Transcript_16860:1811-2638(-)
MVWVASPQFGLPALTKHRSSSSARKPRRKSRSVPAVAHTSATTTSSAASWPVKGSSAVPGCASVAFVVPAQAPSQVASTKAPSGTVPKNEASAALAPTASGAPTLAVSTTTKLEPSTRSRPHVPLTDSRPPLRVPADRHTTVAVADATGVVGMLVVGCGVEGFDVGAAVGAVDSVGANDGGAVGGGDGWVVGSDVGVNDGAGDVGGSVDGIGDGGVVGSGDGARVGFDDGRFVGATEGSGDGACVGLADVGPAVVGARVGRGVGTLGVGAAVVGT